MHSLIPGRLLRRSLLCAVFALTALSSGVSSAKPSSYLGMGTQTGTPSGDVRAAIETKKDLTDPVLSPDGVPVGGDNEVERPAIVKELSFNRSMRLGIQERLGRTSNAEMVNMTKDYLARMFGYANVSVYYLSDKDLTSAVRTGQVDFFIAGSDYFAMEQSMGGVEQIASLWPNYAETPSAVSATVFFMKRTAERKAASMPISAVSGREFIATAPESLGGWLAGAGELVRRQMATYDSLRTRTVFAGQDMPSLLDAVRRDADLVGMLPACELEALERTGDVDPDEFVVINRRADDGLTCRHSSEVYPGWVFGAVSGIDPTLKKAVTAVLLAMSGLKYGSEWALPVTNRSVYDLFYVLKIGPYQDLASWSLQRFVREHAEIIALILLMIFLILSYATSLSILVRRRTKALREALSERDRIEAEAVQSRQHIANLERTGIVGQMSTIIAHELKQPLGAITNYGNGLLRRLHRGDLDPKRFEEALQEVVLQADRASKIVERVRSYAKHDYPPRKVADLSIIIENAIQTFRRSRTTNAELIVRMHSHSMAEVDSWEIELAILNLLKNAADAISGVMDPKIEVGLEPDGEENWILTVGDNGPYISDEQLSHFFKPLQTSKGAAGMGLGLSIVANIAERHAGNITVARNGPRGVKFTMTFPRLAKIDPAADLPENRLGPETVSIYESGGNGPVVRSVVGDGRLDPAAIRRSDIPVTVHSGSLSRAVDIMQEGAMRRGPSRRSTDPDAIDESDVPRNA